MRKLATIREIKDIQPIENADMIELVTIDGWKVIAGKDVNHQIGDLVVYCEVDSYLPVEPEFEFLRKSSFKRMGDEEGFRLKTIKLRGQISQGLIIPLGDAINVIVRLNSDKSDYDFKHPNLYPEGTDVTALLGIQKFEPPIPAQLAGTVEGNFPGFIQKTDEERIQNLVKEYLEWVERADLHFYIGEKLDGTSSTYFIRDGVFGVCSRNLELKRPGVFVDGTTVVGKDGIERPVKENTYWKIARELDLESKMMEMGGNFALQGEIIGEGIQGNKYRLKGQTIRFFNMFDIDLFKNRSKGEFLAALDSMGLQSVPIPDNDFQLPKTVDEMLLFAEGKSQLHKEVEREGLVVRSTDMSISFKAISNKFLIKHKE